MAAAPPPALLGLAAVRLASARLANARAALAATPGRIVGGFALIAAALLLAALVNLVAASSARRAIQTIGADAEPSVVAALRIGATLSAMDAAAASDALEGGVSAAGTSARWQGGKTALDALMIEASRNITYPAETAAVAGLMRWAGWYQTALAEARAAADPARPFTAIQRMQWAHRVVEDFALPEVAILADANRKPLEDAYRAYQADGGVVVKCVSLALAIAALVGVQVFLMRRTGRVLNLPLAAATLVCAALLVGAAIATLREQASVRIAKEDCYDSLNPLFDAKGVAAALDADLALWLFDPATRDAAAAASNARALTLADKPGQPTGFWWRDAAAVRDVSERLEAAQGHEDQLHPGLAKDAAPKLTGLLGRELGNITFGTAERTPASDAVRLLAAYLNVSDRVRQHASPRRQALTPAEAQDRLYESLRVRRTSAAALYAHLTAALDETIAVNQREFDRAIAEAGRLAWWTPGLTCAGLALAGLLAAAGLWQRLREYA